MAKTVVVLCPPQSFPEAFVDFCQLQLQVIEPVLLYSQAALKSTAKRLSSVLNSSTLVCISHWTRSSPAEYIGSLREVASRQAQDCVFLLSCEEMEELCRWEGAESGSLGLGLGRGVEWTLERKEFQAYLRGKMGELWESVPQMDIHMHLAAMRETVLLSLKEELIRQPGDYSPLLSDLQVKITQIVTSMGSQIEQIHLSSIESIKEAAMQRLEEARTHFEATRNRLETQAQAIMQEQGELVSLLAEANEALLQAKGLKEKLSSYEEVNRQTQQVVQSLKQGPAFSPSPAVSVPPKPEKSPETPLSLTGNVSLPKVNFTSSRMSNEPPPVSKAYSVEIPAGKQGLKLTSRTSMSKSRPVALSSSSVIIEEIAQNSDNMENLTVSVRNNTNTEIEGASMYITGAPRPIPDKVPTLSPGPSKFEISCNSLPDSMETVEFFLCKGSQDISGKFVIDFDQADTESVGRASSFPPVKPSYQPAKPSYPQAKPSYQPTKPSYPPAQSTPTIPNPSPVSDVPGLTPEQSIRYAETLKLLGGSAQPAVLAKIKKLLQDPAYEAMNPHQLLEVIFST